jgi:hypothetical protein
VSCDPGLYDALYVVIEGILCGWNQRNMLAIWYSRFWEPDGGGWINGLIEETLLSILFRIVMRFFIHFAASTTPDGWRWIIACSGKKPFNVEHLLWTIYTEIPSPHLSDHPIHLLHPTVRRDLWIMYSCSLLPFLKDYQKDAQCHHSAVSSTNIKVHALGRVTTHSYVRT